MLCFANKSYACLLVTSFFCEVGSISENNTQVRVRTQWSAPAPQCHPGQSRLFPSLWTAVVTHWWVGEPSAAFRRLSAWGPLACKVAAARRLKYIQAVHETATISYVGDTFFILSIDDPLLYTSFQNMFTWKCHLQSTSLCFKAEYDLWPVKQRVVEEKSISKNGLYARSRTLGRANSWRSKM